jgi:hypothetical protein
MAWLDVLLREIGAIKLQEYRNRTWVCRFYVDRSGTGLIVQVTGEIGKGGVSWDVYVPATMSTSVKKTVAATKKALATLKAEMHERRRM